MSAQLTSRACFHVYQKDWVPFVGQAVAFEREPRNVHDCFAVVGHVPIELSRDILIFFALQRDVAVYSLGRL